ncbi:hypothetical protein GH714_023205 [Hevea brasiliensis]|uniref:PPC domain-containing protein n=1 Tax=Hevea brasiliensis TaxID=3981 RepID=A0A6A6KJK7_HEVBR|nr:hypothetical protein GH714_023205 [Hevea brasiliensis]
MASGTQTSCKPPFKFTVSNGGELQWAQGQVLGGIVAGKVLAANLVVVVATTFLNPTFHRLPSDNDEAMETKSSCCGPANESCVSYGMSMTVYGVANPAAINCQVSPDIMRWGPPPRPYTKQKFKRVAKDFGCKFDLIGRPSFSFGFALSGTFGRPIMAQGLNSLRKFPFTFSRAKLLMSFKNIFMQLRCVDMATEVEP